ncbi:MAG: NADH:flavin oxidoreductase, partial [Spirochaetes bacterium]|nr:NADH:flavin oxidoreductase [Spirochaetota bacterium]
MSTPIRSDVFTPARIGGLELPNRLIRAGCYEGLARDGNVTDRLIEHHRRLAAGGIAMTTLGYLAVSSDGRGFTHELWARPELAPQLCRFTDSVHAAGATASVQLVHCGFFSNPKVIGKRPLGASPKLCMYRGAVCAEMTPAQIGEKVADFARAARLARDAGFDAVELHAGHGYLLSQFLSPWTNRRRDEYGGSLENRLRFPAEVVRAMRDAVGAGFPILVKLNQRDGFPGGLEIDEAVEVARRFEREGASALVPSCGFTARTPLYMMRGRVPTREMAANGPDPFTRFATRLFSGLFVQRYPFAPLFLLEGSRRIREAVGIPVVYVGGALSLGHMEKVLGAGCPFIQIGRSTVRDPEFPRRLKSGEVTESDCDQCNRCIAA